MGFDCHAVGHRPRDDVGQVILALGVVVFQRGNPLFEMPGGHRENAGVDFGNRALGVGLRPCVRRCG